MASAQATAEATTLGDPLAYFASDAFIVKETLTNRQILIRELMQAEQGRKSKENSVTRLKSSTSVKREKVDTAISELDEALSAESYLKQKTERVTGNLLLEKRKWFDRTSTEVISSIREYALRQIEAERRTLATLESVRPDVRAIDASGGLSRLGRENTPAGRRISMASSQTAKGDAWSGVARSREGLSRAASGFGSVHEADEPSGNTNGDAAAVSAAGGRSRSGTLSSLKETQDEDDDRVDARNAASRLAQSTF
jgi:vacuolar-type H+-ATPase subunit I/STV1